MNLAAANYNTQETIDIFQSGFGQFLKSGEFSDLILVKNERQFRAHKVILSYASEWFRNQISTASSSSDDPQQPAILDLNNVTFATSDIELLLEYLYKGRVEFTPANSIVLLGNNHLPSLEICSTRCLFRSTRIIHINKGILIRYCFLFLQRWRIISISNNSRNQPVIISLVILQGKSPV